MAAGQIFTTEDYLLLQLRLMTIEGGAVVWDQLMQRSQPSLQVGLTDYKDHMGTNLSPEVDQWVGGGEDRWDSFTLDAMLSTRASCTCCSLSNLCSGGRGCPYSVASRIELSSLLIVGCISWASMVARHFNNLGHLFRGEDFFDTLELVPLGKKV